MTTRRKVLIGAFASSIFAPCPASANSRLKKTQYESRLALSALVTDPGAATALGRSLTLVHPDLFSNDAALVLQRRLGCHSGSQILSMDVLRYRFDLAIREDFAEGRIVDLHGWQLAWSEAIAFAVCAKEEIVFG